MNNEKNIQVIIDSSTDIAPRLENRVHIVPLTLSFNGKEYLDGIDMSRMEFYEKLEYEDVMPKTSQVTPAAFDKVFAKIHEKGQEAIVITVSSGLSGTWQSASLAAQAYSEIRVVDSCNVAIGAGILTEYAIQCIDQGMNLRELEAVLIKMRSKVRLIAKLDTLEFLKRGGRISKTTALAGGMMHIKPVITIEEGQIRILGKARGAKKANNYLTQQVQEFGADTQLPVLLGYTGTSDTLLKNYIQDSRSLWETQLDNLEYTQICSVVGTHAGPGAVGVAFFSK